MLFIFGLRLKVTFRKEPQLIRLDCDVTQNDSLMSISKVPQIWRIFLTNLKLKGLVGVAPSDKVEQQIIIVSVSLLYKAIAPRSEIASDQLACYQKLIQRIESILYMRHIPFVESLAEEIAIDCFQDQRVVEVIVKVEKPDAFSHADTVGVEITRKRENDTYTLEIGNQ